MDCTEGGKETCNSFSVRGYPTLKIFKGGEMSQEYNGPREASKCESFCQFHRLLGHYSEYFYIVIKLYLQLHLLKVVVWIFCRDLLTQAIELYPWQIPLLCSTVSHVVHDGSDL